MSTVGWASDSGKKPKRSASDLKKQLDQMKGQNRPIYRTGTSQIKIAGSGGTKIQLPSGSVGFEQLTPELREFLGVPDSVERRTCPKCEEEKLMDTNDYLCRKCR